MKIKNLFYSFLLVCLALLVCGGATVPALQFQAQAAQLRVAGNNDGKLKGEELFDKDGHYNFRKDDLIAAVESGKVFNFFGYDWRVVFVNEDQNVATFWMADPYTGAIFNETTWAGDGLYHDLTDGVVTTNIWSNGYTNTDWQDEDTVKKLGRSAINKFLESESERIIYDEKYAKYKDRVVKGSVIGTNEVATTSVVERLAYSNTDINNVTIQPATSELTAKYGLGTESILWLPSVVELVQNWQVKEEFLKWTDNTNNAGRAWLRTPDKEESNYAMCISNDAKTENAEEKPYQNCFVFRPVKQVAGVRPAIHLNIKDIDTVVYVNNKWFNEDWMKALFIGVCVVGVVGIGIVTFAVIAKARNKA